MKRVLIVSYYFPPMAGGGVYRMAKFCKYLNLFGWLPIVLCAKAKYFPVRDETILKDLPKDLKVYGTLRFDQSEFLKILWKCGFKSMPKLANEFIFFPDEHITWLIYALIEGIKVIRKERIDVIFASQPPPTSQVVGYILSQLTKKPLVLDFRDEWAETEGIEFATEFHKSLNLKLEEKIINKASAIIAVNDVLLENLKKIHKCDDKIWECITNGYDSDDFEPIENFSRDENKLTITFMGAFYQDRAGWQFFEATKSLIESKVIDEKKFELITIGPNYSPRFIPSYRWVRNVGYVKGFPKTFGILKNSDVLLEIGTDRDSVVRGKIFEYLYLRKPIFALIKHNSAEAKILKECTQEVIIVEPADQEKIKESIVNIYKKWERGELKKNIDVHNIERFHRRNTTKKLSEVLEACVKFNWDL